jgi:hypothetical protein
MIVWTFPLVPCVDLIAGELGTLATGVKGW